MNIAMREALESVESDDSMNQGTRACEARGKEFSTVTEMRLAGAAMMPAARKLITERMNRYWRNRSSLFVPERPDEVIIGAGLHASVYAAARVAAGFPKPVILERGKVGGAFAVTDCASFYLNSRNMPGQNGRPDRSLSGINFLPGAPVQPDMLTGREYQSNADMAFAIRASLAEYGEVYTGADVTDISYSGTITLASGMQIYAGRVIDARGLGDTATEFGQKVNGITVQTFPQFMSTLDGMFPLKGLERVAVFGGGDSGKVTVEALLGIGPKETSLSGLDYVRQVDWYASSLPRNREDWAATQRGRYQRIGRYLARQADVRSDGRYDGAERLRIYNRRGTAIPTLNGALVGSRAYDRVILCTGNSLPALGLSARRFYETEGNLAKDYDSERVIYRVGPAASLRFDDQEYDDFYTDNTNNRVAIFRLAPRTAALAATLPSPVNPYR